MLSEYHRFVATCDGRSRDCRRHIETTYGNSIPLSNSRQYARSFFAQSGWVISDGKVHCPVCHRAKSRPAAPAPVPADEYDLSRDQLTAARHTKSVSPRGVKYQRFMSINTTREVLGQRLSTMMPGIDWRGSAKGHMADAYERAINFSGSHPTITDEMVEQLIKEFGQKQKRQRNDAVH